MTAESNAPTNVEPEEWGASDDAVIGRAFRWSLVAIIGLGAAIAGGVYALRPGPAPAPVSELALRPPERRQRPKSEPPIARFADVTQAAGITFVHQNGAYGDKLLPETMGGGCAFFDYDNDGDQDLFLVNSDYWPGKRAAGARAPTMALFRNDGTGKFADVTKAAGLDASFYGMGVAAGDFDNDGWVDLFVTAVGLNRLFHNRQGKFVEVADAMGVAGNDRQWSTSCGWLDYDNDGDLDLFVCNYVRWSKEIDLALHCTLDGQHRAYCPPTAFEGAFPYLYRNDGGRFADVSAAAGVQIVNPATGRPLAKSLGLAPVDVDRDGWIDVVVANDTVQNLLLHNRRNGTFEEIGVPSGVAFDAAGKARGAMGIDAGYFRNNEALGLGIGNFANEMSALYVAERESLIFSDDAIATGFGPPTRSWLTFGLFWFDFDLDGRLDLFSANGHLEDDIQRVQASQTYAQPAQLYWNCGPDETTEFIQVSAERCGDELLRPQVGRGAAYADIDADGDLDVLVTTVAGPPKLFRNDQNLGHHWLRLKLVGKRANRDAIGSWVEVQLGAQLLRRPVMPTRSYVSQSELPVTIGVGAAKKIDRVTVVWPDGTRQPLADVPLDRLLRVEQR